MEYDLTLFEKGLEELGIALSLEQKKQFITYYEYLVEKNKVMNLTAITEYNEVILKHFLDSLSIVKVGSFDQKKADGKVRDRHRNRRWFPWNSAENSFSGA